MDGSFALPAGAEGGLQLSRESDDALVGNFAQSEYSMGKRIEAVAEELFKIKFKDKTVRNPDIPETVIFEREVVVEEARKMATCQGYSGRVSEKDSLAAHKKMESRLKEVCEQHSDAVRVAQYYKSESQRYKNEISDLSEKVTLCGKKLNSELEDMTTLVGRNFEKDSEITKLIRDLTDQLNRLPSPASSPRTVVAEGGLLDVNDGGGQVRGLEQTIKLAGQKVTRVDEKIKQLQKELTEMEKKLIVATKDNRIKEKSLQRAILTIQEKEERYEGLFELIGRNILTYKKCEKTYKDKCEQLEQALKEAKAAKSTKSVSVQTEDIEEGSELEQKNEKLSVELMELNLQMAQKNEEIKNLKKGDIKVAEYGLQSMRPQNFEELGSMVSMNPGLERAMNCPVEDEPVEMVDRAVQHDLVKLDVFSACTQTEISELSTDADHLNDESKKLTQKLQAEVDQLQKELEASRFEANKRQSELIDAKQELISQEKRIDDDQFDIQYKQNRLKEVMAKKQSVEKELELAKLENTGLKEELEYFQGQWRRDGEKHPAPVESQPQSLIPADYSLEASGESYASISGDQIAPLVKQLLELISESKDEKLIQQCKEMINQASETSHEDDAS